MKAVREFVLCRIKKSHRGYIILTVTNFGKPIPHAAMARLFLPFSRGEVKPGQQWLRLGLYIASEIAKAPNGTLGVASTAQQTSFTLQMPIDCATIS